MKSMSGGGTRLSLNLRYLRALTKSNKVRKIGQLNCYAPGFLCILIIPDNRCTANFHIMFNKLSYMDMSGCLGLYLNIINQPANHLT